MPPANEVSQFSCWLFDWHMSAVNCNEEQKSSTMKFPSSRHLYTGNRKNTIVITIYSNPEERYSIKDLCRTRCKAILEGKSKHGRHRLLREHWCRNQNFSLEIPRTVHDIWVFTKSWSRSYKLYGVSFTVHVHFFVFWLIRAEFGGLCPMKFCSLQSSKKLLKFLSLYFPQSIDD